MIFKQRNFLKNPRITVNYTVTRHQETGQKRPGLGMVYQKIKKREN